MAKIAPLSTYPIWKTDVCPLNLKNTLHSNSILESCALYASLMLCILFKCCFSKSNHTNSLLWEKCLKRHSIPPLHHLWLFFSMPANNHYTKVRNLFLRRAATDQSDHYYYHSHLYFMLCFAHLFCDITQIIIKIRIIKLLCGENSELQLLLLFVFHFLSHPLFVSTVFFGIIWESTLMWTSIMHCDF